VPGLSDQWWAEVTHSFRAHVRQETALLAGYEKLAAETSDPTIRYLLEMILADEHRHHDQFEDMTAAAMVGPATAGPTGAPPAPAPDEVARLLELTETFLDLEHEDADELAALRKKVRPVRHESLWHLLVSLMELDTAKHIATLEFLRDELRRAR
jgi:hypothetical protein